MRAMVDTNILFSAILFPQSKPATVLRHICESGSLVLCDHVINELFDAIGRKRPDLFPDAELFLAELQYEAVITPRAPQKLISDPKDAPILNAAILADVDIIISGDKHFLELDMERPETMKAAEYLERYAEDE